MSDSLKTLRIVTHDGEFHADDLFAVAMAWTGSIPEGGSVFAMSPGVLLHVTRSRKPEDWERASVVVDVGGRYDVSSPDKLWLDHHQPSFKEVRPDGVPYAAAGLAWRHFGPNVVRYTLYRLPQLSTEQKKLVREHLVERVCARVDHLFVAGLDADDVGYDLATQWNGTTRPTSLAGMLHAANCLWFSSAGLSTSEAREGDDRVFQHLLHSWVGPMLMLVVSNAIAAEMAQDLIEKALRERPDSYILVLDQMLPWQDALLASSAGADVLYVVCPDSTGIWRVNAVPDGKGGFGLRRPLPATWAGLRRASESTPDQPSLEFVTGVADAVFCHRACFTAGAASRAGAVQMACLALSDLSE